jgi:hypothetical protein
MNSAEDDEVKSRVPLAAWIPAAIIGGLLILLVIGILVLS